MSNTIIGDEVVAEPVQNFFTHDAVLNDEQLSLLFSAAFDEDFARFKKKGRINTEAGYAKSRELFEKGEVKVEDLHMMIDGYHFAPESTAYVFGIIVQRLDIGNEEHYLIGSSKIGMNFDAEFLKGIDLDLARKIMKVVAVAHATNTFAFRVGSIYNNVSLTAAEMDFVENTSRATSSWFKAANNLPKCKLAQLQEPSSEVLIDLSTLPKLDYNKCVLGASSGKESTFNRFILKDSMYEVHEITFKNVEDIHSEGASMELICLDDAALTRMYLYPLTIQSEDKDVHVAFDAQGVISIPRYAMLIIEALKKNAGNLAVGTEFGCSKIWYPHDPENTVKGTTIHDLAVDEGAYICQQIEGMFKNYGLEVYIIAPTAVLHEVGILRALVETKGFNLADLKSCWRANYLQHNYCGVCYKCQRLAKYYNYLHTKKPELKFKSFIDFKDLNFATGTMLSYSMQYHIFEEHPELPWHAAICIDNENMKLLDYRTGNRIMKVLMMEYGFEHVIMASLYKNPNSIVLQPSEAIINALKTYVHIDYLEKLKEHPVKLNNCFLELPGEKEFRDNLTPTMKEELKSIDLGVILSHVDRFPIFSKGEDGLGTTWKWVTLHRTNKDAKPEPVVLKLTQEALDNVLVRRWLSEKSVLEGLNHYNIGYDI
ncbi:hypothetical protein [Yersinia ruckeri]|uniref:hypothetical protein n=1 Tax=Yersinia ruckeri TaxID=29486 RepID=UPI00223778F3|nr:hypothetical protein [Yersinia ruckeri]MCW6598803.1 hypothetical protein [Yersinia ruckeri]